MSAIKIHYPEKLYM